MAGVVFLPFSQELFVGVPGRGAFLNGRPIRASRSEDLSDAVVTVSFGKTPETMRCMTHRLEALLPQVRKARCLGAAAAELAYVAAGFLGGLVYEGINLWDFAAGKIILEAAGGFLEATEAEPDLWRVIAGAPGLHDALISQLDAGKGTGGWKSL
jgi:fructose-1,6-bisphosphatase/inositol monophosphatase family enzyme